MYNKRNVAIRKNKMPSSEDVALAQNQVKNWARQQLAKEGHSQKSVEEILKYMPYLEQIKKAELINGPIYRGPYSPY